MERRLRQNFDLRHGKRALAMRSADAVRSGIAAADDDDMLATRIDHAFGRRAGFIVARDAPILLAEIVHREMNTAKRTSRQINVARKLGPAGEDHHFIIVDMLIGEQLPRIC